MLALDPDAARIRVAVEDLESVITDLMQLLAGEFMPRAVQEHLHAPMPEEQDRETVAWLRGRLQASLRREPVGPPSEIQVIENLAFRARVFLDELDRLTG